MMARPRTTTLIAIIAAIGFAFDSYELLMLPLIVRPALMELLGVPATDPAINQWVGYLFYWPAVAGGVFGLLGGYLTDLFGRRRVLTWSILLYAFSAFAAGYSTTIWSCSFCAARHLSACAWNSSPRWLGLQSCSLSPSNASACWATRNSFHPSAAF